MAEVNVKTEISISAPIEKVFAFASEPDNAPKWYVNIHSSVRLPSVKAGLAPPALAIGSHIAFKAKFLGKELSYTYEIKELVQNKKLVMATANGPFPMETTYLFEKTDNGQTKMTLINRGTPSGFSKLFAPIMSMAMRKANTKDLILLKQILEKENA
jgi:uncharacterized protein YndB with AHSA1/START domain